MSRRRWKPWRGDRPSNTPAPAPVTTTSGPPGRPTRSGRRYTSQAEANARCRFLNTYGKQRDRWAWIVWGSDDEGYELRALRREGQPQPTA